MGIMENRQQRARDFMKEGGQDCPEVPTIPNEETLKLRANLLLEEVFEFVDGLGFELTLNGAKIQTSDFILKRVKDANIVDMADAIGDISYINYGNALTLGLDMEPIENAIHSANMKKFGPGSWKREDGKIMKPADWEGPEERIKNIVGNL